MLSGGPPVVATLQVNSSADRTTSTRANLHVNEYDAVRNCSPCKPRLSIAAVTQL